MSSADEHAGAILAPYAGAGLSRAQRTWRRLLIPLVVFCCLIYGLLFGFFGPLIPAPFAAPLAVMGGIAVWALPDMARAPTRSVEVLFFVFMLALILWPNYLAIALPGLPWITLLRIIAAPMTVLLLICVSVSARFRGTLAQTLNVLPILWKLVAAFAVLQVLTIMISPHPVSSLNRVINAEFYWTATFFIACYVFTKPGRPTLWAALLCLTLIPIFLIIVKEHAASRLPWADHIPSFLKIDDPTVQRILAGGFRWDQYRVQATFSTALGLAEYIALTMPFLLYFVTGPYRLVYRIAAAVAVPICFEVVLLTDSRLGLIGCIISLLMYGVLLAWQMWQANKKAILAPMIVLGYPAVAAVTFASTILIGRIRERIWGSGQYAASNEGRAQMYHDGIPLILKRPWGVGAGEGADRLGFHDPAGILTIDSYYLVIGLEYGIIGFLIYYGMFIIGGFAAGREAVRLGQRGGEYGLFIPISICLTNYILIKSVFSNDDNHPLVHIVLGMAVALLARLAQERKPANDAARALRS